MKMTQKHFWTLFGFSFFFFHIKLINLHILSKFSEKVNLIPFKCMFDLTFFFVLFLFIKLINLRNLNKFKKGRSYSFRLRYHSENSFVSNNAFTRKVVVIKLAHVLELPAKWYTCLHVCTLFYEGQRCLLCASNLSIHNSFFYYMPYYMP